MKIDNTSYSYFRLLKYPCHRGP